MNRSPFAIQYAVLSAKRGAVACIYRLVFFDEYPVLLICVKGESRFRYYASNR